MLFPPDIPHAAWTEHSEVRAFMVEFTGADDSDLARRAVELLADPTAPRAAPRPIPVERASGEPAWPGTIPAGAGRGSPDQTILMVAEVVTVTRPASRGVFAALGRPG